MEIKYTNTVEDIEFSILHWMYKYTWHTKYKYFVILIAVINGIHYSIKYDTVFYFFTISLAMSSVVFICLNNEEPRVAKRIVKKLSKRDNYYTAEKTLSIDNGSIAIKYLDNILEIKLSKRSVLDVLDDYVIILPRNSYGYKNDIIIPNKYFNSEEEKNIFIEQIELLINNSK